MYAYVEDFERMFRGPIHVVVMQQLLGNGSLTICIDLVPRFGGQHARDEWTNDGLFQAEHASLVVDFVMLR